VRVLVIEDDRAARNALIKLLEKEGHGVCWARSDTGIAQMRREKPDLVVLDIALAEMGGWKLVWQRLNDPELRTISTIILSGTTDDDLRSHALASVLTGGSLVLNGPYRPERLMSAIERLQSKVSEIGTTASSQSERTTSAPGETTRASAPLPEE
jgi:DNA-binding response OmpR family regulator